ncbi:MAG: serine/threonine-protein kinase, partial [Pseudomonadota bacterium]
MDITRLSPGTIVDNNRIEREIGRGGFGVVYLAFDLERKRQVALKFLNRESLLESFKIKHSDNQLTQNQFEERFSEHYLNVTERFKEEYQKQLTSARHPNIATVYQFGFFEGLFFFTSEYIEGYDIFVFTRTLSEEGMIPLFIQMLEGLQFIHDNGLLHGDIKPENILIKKENDKSVAKIIDFGIATAITGDKKQLLGTPMYVSPEIMLQKPDQIGITSDLFSAAALMYYCLSNTYPFLDRYGWDNKAKKLAQIIEKESPPKTLKKLISSMPDYLNTIVMRLLEKETHNRFYGSARAVINALKTRAPDDFKENLESKSSYLISNVHIGQEDERNHIKEALNLLTLGNQPSPFSIFCISGETGFGKTGFLNDIKEVAEKNAEKLSLHSIRLPADFDSLQSWVNRLSITIDKNIKPLILLIDDLHLLNCNQSESKNFMNSIVGLSTFLIERENHPALHLTTKPVIICFSTHPEYLTSSLVFELSKIKNIPMKRIDLQPFSEEDVRTFLNSTVALKDKEISPDWIKTLLHQTGGVPAELCECLIQRDSQGLLFDLEGKVHFFSAPLPEVIKTQNKIPLTSETRLLKKYDELIQQEKNLLDFISVWSFKSLTPPPRLTDLKHFFPGMRLTQMLTDLIQKQILNSQTYNFDNPYFSDIIYKKVDDKERQRLHSQISFYLKTVSAPQGSILLHSGFSGKDITSKSSLIKLARHLIFRKGCVSLAGEILEHSIENDGNVELHIYMNILLIHAHYYAGEYEIAEQLYKKFSETVDSIPQILLLRLYSAILPVYIALKRFD